MNTNIVDAFARLGFALASTGGGCTAFIAYGPKGESLYVVRAETPSAPTSLAQRAELFIYPNDEEALSSDKTSDMLALVPVILRWVEAHYGDTLRPSAAEARDAALPVVKYETSIRGNHILAESYPDAEPDVLLSIPDDSLLFGADRTWSPDYLRAAIRCLQSELDRIENR